MAARQGPPRRSDEQEAAAPAADDVDGQLAGDAPPPTPETSTVSVREWLARPFLLGLTNGHTLVLLVLLVALIITRFWDLGTRAMHHDESMHAKYAWDTYRGQFYKYNPLLHGPFQFFVVALSFWLFGATEATARFAPAAFGVALVLLLFAWRRQLGALGLLFTVGLLTFSPSFTYFSRFLREDSYVTTWTLLFAVGLVNYFATHRRAWLYTAAIGLAFAFTTKETTYITAFIFGTFVLGNLALEWWRRRRRPSATARSGPGPITAAWQAVFRDRAGFWGIGAFWGAIFLVGLILVLLFTSFGSNPPGIREGLTGSLTYWWQQHGVQRGNQPLFYYVLTLSAYEVAGLVFGLAGMVAAVRRPTLFTAFLSWWFVLAFVLYGYAGEKMPWLTLQIALPMTILAGWFLGQVFSQPRPWRVGARAALAVLVVLGLYTIHTGWPVSFERGDVPKDLLVYTQTSPDVPKVMRDIEDLSLKTVGDHQTIGVVSTAGTWWPFSWYLRDFKNAEFPSQLSAAPSKPIVLVALDEDAKNQPFLNGYSRIKYRMRWWFPEDYRQLRLSTLWRVVVNPDVRNPFLRWLWQRETISPLGSYDFYVYIRDGYGAGVPLAGQLAAPESPQQAAERVAAAERARQYVAKAVALQSRETIASSGGGSGQLRDPRGLALDADGNVYVADSLNHRIQKFAPDGRLLFAWGTKGDKDGQFNEPLGVLVHPETGEVYVADTWNHRIQKFDANGAFLMKWGTGAISSQPGEFYGPRALAWANDTIYVTDTGNKRIQKFAVNGSLVGQIGVGGQGDGQLNEPIGLAVTAEGEVFVADTNNGRVQQFDANGKFVRQWPVSGWTGQVRNEAYIAVDDAGHVFITDPPSNRVLKFNHEGTLLAVGTVAPRGDQALNFPTGIAVAGDRLYVSDTLNGRVRIFDMLPDKQ